MEDYSNDSEERFAASLRMSYIIFTACFVENKSYFGEGSARGECRKECSHLSVRDF